MDQRTAADRYRTASIETAPPIKIVRLLYEGAMRFLEQAAVQNPEDPRSTFLELIGRADAIITELRLAIDHSVDSGVTEDLERLYLFCEDELGRAGMERSIAPTEGVLRVLAILLDAWRRVELETAQSV